MSSISGLEVGGIDRAFQKCNSSLSALSVSVSPQGGYLRAGMVGATRNALLCPTKHSPQITTKLVLIWRGSLVGSGEQSVNLNSALILQKGAFLKHPRDWQHGNILDSSVAHGG